MIRLILLDDHALIRRGMRDVLEAEAGMTIAGEAGSHEELQALMATTSCDVLVLDINLPGASGLDVLAALQQRADGPRTLVVSMYPEDQYAVKALRAGAWGYVNKSADSAVLVEAIRSVAQGRKYISPAIAALLVERLVAPAPTLAHERLSERELQMLVMIAQGQKLADIALQLDLSPKTVSVYRARLLEKMKLSTNAEMAHYAAKHGLL
ncbi:response regulator transcription factor [uncultured Ramlibacter sp.]|uniref:response regulator n=1 Tax=uncultured Ramlibacter sp. TaxID=260755 RepID=UPI00262D32A8|nr:response regulator transcription factor [uncultured Ramlibacter sp.]